MLQLCFIQPHVFTLVKPFLPDQVLGISSDTSVLQCLLYFKLHFAINFSGRYICPKSVIVVWPKQAYVEDVMYAAQCSMIVASGQVKLVGSFSYPLHHLEVSYEAVL